MYTLNYYQLLTSYKDKCIKHITMIILFIIFYIYYNRYICLHVYLYLTCN